MELPGYGKGTADLHMFKYRDKQLVYDVNSGSLHEVADGPAWELLMLQRDGLSPAQSMELLASRYPSAVIAEARSEIETLVAEKLLFSPSPMLHDRVPGSGVKALCLYISQSCNLRCGYCFARPATEERQIHMSREVAFSAVDLLLEQERGLYCEIDFFGGEPLLNFPLIREIVSYARSAGRRKGKEFTFTLTTNAILLDETIASFLNEENISAILSIDGRPVVHDRMRRTAANTGSYEMAMPRIKKFLDSRDHQNYYIRGTYTAHNLDFCSDIEHFLEEGFQYFSLEPVLAKTGADYALSLANLSRLEQEYDRLVDLFLQHRAMGQPFHFYHFAIDLEKGPCLYKRISGCGAGVDYLAVAANGSLYPCHQFVGDDTFLLGRVSNGSSVFDLQRGEQVAASADRRKACSGCWARYLCGKGCAAASYYVAGDLQANSEIYCALQLIRLERALYLQSF